MTDSRERRLQALCAATGESTKSKAIDTATSFYLRMRGDTGAVPTGAFTELLEQAEEQGSLTLVEIAEILDTEELPLHASTSWRVGESE